MMYRTLFAAVLVMTSTFAARSGAGEPTPLGQSLKDIETAEHWIYDDLPRALAEAKRSGKPLLIVLRCVPCPPGRTLDEQVMMPDADLEALEKQFVCVRVIKTNGIDLDFFQYDYDMSFSTLFVNADRTIYGRYGTRYATGAGSDGNLSAAAFAKAAERALELHRNYPENKAQLAAKVGKPVEWKKPEDTPGLTDRRGAVVVRQNCIHCHMVKDYALRAKWEQGRLKETDLFVYPAPAQVGLTLDRDDGLKVTNVKSGSPAAAAGLEVGDELVTAGGQPLVSTADFTWVLHTSSPGEVSVPVTVRRGGDTIEATLALADGWKRTDIAWRASSWYGLRGGMKVDPVAADARTSRGLPEGGGALEIKGIFGKSAPVVQKAGLKKGDVIVGMDGAAVPDNESDFLVQLRLKHGPRDQVRFSVVRNGQRQEVSVPMW